MCRERRSVPGFPTAPVWARYRCFLPDLAGLAGIRRVGPGTRGSLSDHAGPLASRAVDSLSRFVGWTSREAR